MAGNGLPSDVCGLGLAPVAEISRPLFAKRTPRPKVRFVALFAKRKGEARFLVVDLNRPSADQGRLVRRFYGGRIPHLTVLDARGKAVYNRSGETARERADPSALEKLLEEALGH